MLITFKSKNSGEVMMLAKHALAVLKAAGRDYGDTMPAQGVFTAEQLTETIANLRQAIDEDSHKDLHSYAVHDQEVEQRDKENLEAKHPLIEGVNLSQRAYPLLKMFESAQQHGDDVVWSGGSAW